MKSIMICALAVGVAASGPAFADEAHTKGGYVACVSDDYFSQWVQADVKKDDAARDFLLKNHFCFALKPDLTVSVLHTSWSGVSHIRVYAQGEAVELWTYYEAIKQ